MGNEVVGAIDGPLVGRDFFVGERVGCSSYSYSSTDDVFEVGYTVAVGEVVDGVCVGLKVIGL